MTSIDLSRFLPAFQQRCEKVAALVIEQPDLAAQRDKALAILKNPTDLTATIDAMHRVQRLYFASELNLLGNPQIIEAFQDEKNFPYWADYFELQASESEKHALSHGLYHGYPPMGPLVLFTGDYARGIGERVLAYCIENQDEMDLWVDDRLFGRRMMHCLDEDSIARYGELLAARYIGGKRRIVVFSDSPSVPYKDEAPDLKLENLRQAKFMDAMHKNGLWRTQKFTGTDLPCHDDAEADGLSFEEYVRIFFAMCAVDINEISKAHNVLVDFLNKGEEVHITNSDGTDIRFGIKGMTFLSSLTEANIPGTEVFSSPEREKVNGTIVAKGWFNVPMADNQRVQDITLEFKDGRIASSKSVIGEEYLHAAIEKDEGSHYLGELAFGTNPALTRHVSNGLLVEKIGCSFHVAIGSAYENEDGAIIDNGNKSNVHWDITTMLRGKDGMIAIDGHIIMQGGVYLDSRLAYLNSKD